MMSSLLMNAAYNWTPTASDTAESKENQQKQAKVSNIHK